MIKLLPKNINNYYNPFIGLGTELKNIVPLAKSSFISDNNMDLIVTYNCIKNNAQALQNYLRKNSKAFAFNKENIEKQKERSIFLDYSDPIENAAIFLFLNNNKKVINVQNLSKLLNKHVSGISVKEFNKINPTKGDLVYLNPPYYPSYSRTATNEFTIKDYNILKDFITELTNKEVNVIAKIDKEVASMFQNMYPKEDKERKITLTNYEI